MQNDGFNILFSFNGNYLGNMFVKGDMMMADVVTNLFKNFPLISQCQPTFYINSNEIKATSCKTMKDLGMKNMSSIEIKTMNNQTQMQPGMGMMQPGMGMMQPGVGMMQPGMGMMQPGMGMMQPGVGMMQPGVGMMQPGVGMMQPVVGMMQPGVGMMQPGMGPSVNMPGNKPQNIPGNNGGEDYLNIIFNVEGKVVNVQATKHNKFFELSKKFLIKADAKDKVPSFLLNNSMIESNDNRTLEELHLQNNQRIEVVFTQNVIGAYY